MRNSIYDTKVTWQYERYFPSLLIYYMAKFCNPENGVWKAHKDAKGLYFGGRVGGEKISNM